MLCQKIHHLLVILFFFFFSGIPNLHAQYQYCEFPTENSNWMTRKVWHIAQSILQVTDCELRLTEEDTILSGKTYKKIYSRIRISYVGDSEPLPPLDDITSDQPDKFYMGIREENKKVYIHKFFSAEELLYDFDMSIGDTITGTDHSGFVSKIDTIELGAKLRKRFEVTVLYPPSVPTSTFYIIEGIGSTLSLTPDAPDPPRDVELICMKTSDEVIYLSENYSFCPSIKEILVSNSHDVFEEDNIKIYPNPNNDFLNIETKSGRKVVEVKVFDPTGNLFYSTASFLKREKINTTTWPSGVYIVSFEINGRRFTKRFFKN